MIKLYNWLGHTIYLLYTQWLYDTSPPLLNHWYATLPFPIFSHHPVRVNIAYKSCTWLHRSMEQMVLHLGRGTDPRAVWFALPHTPEWAQFLLERTRKLKRRKVAVLYFENTMRSGPHQELSLPCGNCDDWRGKEMWRCHAEDWLKLHGWGFPWTHPPLTWQSQPERSNGRELPTRAAFGRGAQQDIAPWMAIIKMLSDTEGGGRIMRRPARFGAKT